MLSNGSVHQNTKIYWRWKTTFFNANLITPLNCDNNWPEFSNIAFKYLGKKERKKNEQNTQLYDIDLLCNKEIRMN